MVFRPTKKALQAFSIIMGQPWDTGGLPANNAFTVAVVARAAGFMRAARVLSEKNVSEEYRSYNDEPDVPDAWRICNRKSIIAILEEYLKVPDATFALSPFPASPTIGFWIVDAASKLCVRLESDSAQELANWAAAEFRRQHSLIAAEYQAMMDPVALAMAACLCRSLQRFAEKSVELYEALKKTQFPSESELRGGIKAFFEKQNEQSGVWEKYFPIFHYPTSGPNHCWHFEVLEAVVSEFPEILSDPDTLRRLDKALTWLEFNRLEFRHNGKVFYGWNAGGDIQAMRRGEPESWPTGVAHMFLARLNNQLSIHIRDTVLAKFQNRARSWPKEKAAWDKYLDFHFLKAKECDIVDDRNSVKKLIDKEILEPTEQLLENASLSPRLYLKCRHSAVLFGPPGTSKTTLCAAVAKRLGWYFVELSPSDFLSAGLEGIYNKVSEVFEDLQDLYGVVVLFDEMDALVQSRDVAETDASTNPIDVSQQLLTTSMLPKLQRLNQGGRCIYFMATNYIGSFDGAIIRSGRFDLLVHMGPPQTAEKIRRLEDWRAQDADDEIQDAQKTLSRICTGETKNEFDRFTFGETGRFFYALRLQHDISKLKSAIDKAGDKKVAEAIKQWACSKITLATGVAGKKEWKKYEKDALRVSIQ